MPYAYEKLIKDNNLSESDLNRDAKISIKAIKDAEKAIKMQVSIAEKKGKTYTPTQDTLDKIKLYDKWIVREIMDELEGKETNTDAPPVELEEVIEEIKVDAAAQTAITPVTEPIEDDATKCDKEFNLLIKSGKDLLSLDELKELAPIAYNFISTDTDAIKGIETDKFLLKETEEKNKFKLTTW